MSRTRFSLMALLLVAACDGNPISSGGGSGGGSDPTTPAGEVPTQVSRDMNAMSYEAGVLKIDMQGVSSSGQMATFVRAPALDKASGTGNPKYLAYVYQETGTTRSYLAYVGTNARGNLVAVSAADGGQFNRHNAGGRFERIGTYSRPVLGDGPEQGLFTYIGRYVGIFVPGNASTTANGTPSDFDPLSPFIVTGVAQINADFAHGMVDGGVSDRKLWDQNGTQIMSITIDDGDPTTTNQVIDTSQLWSLALPETTIDDGDQFLGNVEFINMPDADIGDYAGTFGGIHASDVAGVLWLNPIQGQQYIWEYGTFNLPRCDLAGASPLCTPR